MRLDQKRYAELATVEAAKEADPAGEVGEDEPVMLFRAQDELFCEVVAFYRQRHREKYGAETLDIQQACQDHIRRAEAWRKTHPTKRADL
jgi:hypothetical protein